MKYLVVSESSARYLWELQTLFYNLIVTRQLPADQIVLLTYGDESYAEQLKSQFGVEVHFYPDERPSSVYVSSIRPWLMAKYLEELGQPDSFVYIDSDIIQLKDMDWSSLTRSEKKAYGSYAHYVTDDFILSKANGEAYLQVLDSLIPLSDEERERVNRQACGAQWMLNQVDAHFFYQVYADCENLYQAWLKLFYRGNFEEKENNFAYADVWTTDMFVLHRLLVKAGYEVEVADSMSFTFPTREIKAEDDYLFLHNAGVNPQQEPAHKYLFWKSSPHWLTLMPYNTDLSYVEEDKYSKLYVNEMLKMKGYINE